MIFYLLGIIQEYCVIINLYNGDLLPFLDEILEYSSIDILILLLMIIYIKRLDVFDWVFNILCLIAHLQWILHSPFEKWPSWWIGTKSINDNRHRTEYYDTHVMCFCIRLILLIRYYDKKQLKTKLENFELR